MVIYELWKFRPKVVELTLRKLTLLKIYSNYIALSLTCFWTCSGNLNFIRFKCTCMYILKRFSLKISILSFYLIHLRTYGYFIFVDLSDFTGLILRLNTQYPVIKLCKESSEDDICFQMGRVSRARNCFWHIIIINLHSFLG